MLEGEKHFGLDLCFQKMVKKNKVSLAWNEARLSHSNVQHCSRRCPPESILKQISACFLSDYADCQHKINSVFETSNKFWNMWQLLTCCNQISKNHDASVFSKCVIWAGFIVEKKAPLCSCDSFSFIPVQRWWDQSASKCLPLMETDVPSEGAEDGEPLSEM